MNVSLPPHLDGFVRDLVRGGEYASASEVMREGLRMLKAKRDEDQQRAELRRLIQEGLESGPPRAMTGDDIREMIHRHAEKRRAEARESGGVAPKVA